MALRFCDVYTDNGLVAHCELKQEQIEAGNEFYITSEENFFVIDRIEDTGEVGSSVNLYCEPVLTDDVYALIWHHKSYNWHYSKKQDGITPAQAQKLIRLLVDTGYMALQVAATDHKVIIYQVLDKEETVINYFYSPLDAIEWLLEQ